MSVSFLNVSLKFNFSFSGKKPYEMSKRSLILLFSAIVLNITCSYGNTDDILPGNFSTTNADDSSPVTIMASPTVMSSVEIKGTNMNGWKC